MSRRTASVSVTCSCSMMRSIAESIGALTATLIRRATGTAVPTGARQLFSRAWSLFDMDLHPSSAGVVPLQVVHTATTQPLLCSTSINLPHFLHVVSYY